MEYKREIERIIAGLVFAGCFIFFYFFYNYHLYFIEQLQIFLLTSGHFMMYFSRPAFLSSFLGDFLTQFYYLAGGGPLVITLTLILLWFTTRKLINKFTGRDNGSLLPLIPSIFGWIALCDPEFPLAAIIAMIISGFSALLLINLSGAWIRRVTGILLLPVLYMAIGTHFYLFAILAIGYEFSLGRNKGTIITGFMNLMFSLLLPVIMKSFYNITLIQSFTWIDEITRHQRFVNFLPFLGTLVTVIFAWVSYDKILSSVGATISTLLKLTAISIILLAGMSLNADFTFEKILNLDYKANHERWQDVNELSHKYMMRNNLSSYYTNMALGRLNLLPEKLMEFYQPAATGLFIPVNSNENYLTITFSSEIYWQLGDVNASQHSALLGMIFSPRSGNVRLMKRLVEINIVNGEYAVAGKYIKILEKTLFYHDWAAARRIFLYNEPECNRSAWISSKRVIMPGKDLLKAANEYKKTLEMLIEANPGNKMAVDYLLSYDLLTKDIEAFKRDFRDYFRADTIVSLPQVYQEALLIGIVSGKESPDEYKNYIFEPENVKRIADYTRIYDESRGDGNKLKGNFAKTYWFYYHFAKMNIN
jgi:hypothetical protein